MNTGSVEDRLAIRELIEEFAAAVTRLDPDAWLKTWAEEGIWKTPSMPQAVAGKSNLYPAFKARLAYVKFIGMVAFPADLVVEGDRAHGKAYCREFIVPKAGGQRNVVGCFTDEYVKRGGRWCFLSRSYELIGSDP